MFYLYGDKQIYLQNRIQYPETDLTKNRNPVMTASVGEREKMDSNNYFYIGKKMN